MENIPFTIWKLIPLFRQMFDFVNLFTLCSNIYNTLFTEGYFCNVSRSCNLLFICYFEPAAHMCIRLVIVI
jgi:hypothetical protein